MNEELSHWYLWLLPYVICMKNENWVTLNFLLHAQNDYRFSWVHVPWLSVSWPKQQHTADLASERPARPLHGDGVVAGLVVQDVGGLDHLKHPDLRRGNRIKLMHVGGRNMFSSDKIEKKVKSALAGCCWGKRRVSSLFWPPPPPPPDYGNIQHGWWVRNGWRWEISIQ